MRVAVRRWMRRNAAEHADKQTGEVNLTKLAEAAAGEFDIDEQPGPLDDEQHWIWEEARSAAHAYESATNGSNYR